MAPLVDSMISLLARSPHAMTISSLSSLARRSALSPMAIQDLHRRADSPKDMYSPGGGVRSPDAFNKTLFIVLFALIFMALVLTSIYFFFFAKNGGFVWKQNDWEDYKTTVLRRKGPDGKTLSNATKSTKLGGGSIVPKWKESYSDISSTSSKTRSDLEKGHGIDGKRASGNAGRSRQHYHDNRDDPVFKDYAHEQPAGVGGYNKPDDGSRYAPTNPTTSDVSTPKLTRKERKAQEKEEKRAQKEAKAEAKAQAKQHAHAAKVAGPATESMSEQSQSYQSQYRPNNKPTMRAVSGSVDAAYQRAQSKRSQQRLSYNDTDDQSSGTKSYPCHIPGISKSSANQPPKPPRHGNTNKSTNRPRYSFEQSDDNDDEGDDHVPSMTGTAAAAAAATASMFKGRGEVRPDESVSQIGAPNGAYGNRRGYGGGFRRGRGQGAI